MRGTVKFWDGDKGFGFIVPEGGGGDVFCHIKNLAGGGGGNKIADLANPVQYPYLATPIVISQKLPSTSRSLLR